MQVLAPARGKPAPDYILPGEGLTLIVVPHPLLQQRRSIDVVPLGRSLAELVRRARNIADLPGRVEVTLGDGGVVPEALWTRVRPKAGAIVVVRSVAEFGGDNTLVRTVLGAAVTVAGLFATAVNPLLGAAVTIGGQLAINALFPVAPPVLAKQQSVGSSSSPTYSISGGQNVADPYGVVPEIEGRHRVYPKLGAQWYTEFVGADQYLIGLVVWGYGPKEVSGIKIGETPIENFDDLQIETRLGYPDDAPVTLYPSEVVQEDLSVEITATGGAEVRTTAADIDVISVDVVAPSGMLRVDGNGVAQTYTVQLRVDTRAAGSADPWVPLGTLTFTGRSGDPIRQCLRVAVAAGQYDVQVSKTSTDYAGTDQVSEQVVWTALRGFRSSQPISFDKPLAHSAIRIRASSQLTGQIDSLNGMVATRCKAFNGAAWADDTVSNWPPDLFRHVLQGPANARPKPDSRINIANLERWWAYCVAKGFRCNIVFDSPGSVLDRLKAIAACGRAAVTRTDGMYDVIWDEPDAPIVQHFTPRNSRDFSSQRAYLNPPHAFRIRFVNETAGYVQDERIVYDDGYNADGSGGLTAATLFESGIEFPGVTDPALIWRHGRFHIAQARLRPETYQLTTDFEWLVARRGDRVRASHDVVLWGLGAGRVKSVTAGDNDQVTLDEPVTMVADKTYSIRFRAADGTSILRTVITDAGDRTTLTLDGHHDLPAAAGDLFMFGETGSETVVLRVLSIRPGPDFSAVLTLVDDAPEISLADQGAIPAFDSQITIPSDPFTAAPVGLAVTEAYEGVDGATATGALLTWETVAGERPVSFEVEYRDDDGDKVWRLAASSPVVAPLKATFLPGLLQGTWSFRVRCIFADGSASKWAELARVAITSGAGLQLPNVMNVVTSYDDATATISWDPVKFSKLDVFYEVRKGESWETGLLYGPNLAQPRFKIAGNGTYWIAAKAQPLPGITIYSAVPSSIAIAGAILVRNVVATLHEHADGWDGVLTDCTIDGEVLKTDAANTIAYYELAAGKIFDINFLRRMRIDAAVKAVGVPVTQNVLDDPDFLNNPHVLSAGSSAFVEAWVEISVAGDVDNDVFAAGDVFVAPDVFAGGAVFGPYQKFAPGEFEGRFFKLRAAFRSLSDAVYAALTEFDITGDVPDRIDHYSGLAIAAAGTSITFKPNGSATAKEFKAGPGTDALPHYQVTWNNTAGDELVVSDLSTAGMTIQILNGGAPQDRVANIEVQGW